MRTITIYSTPTCPYCKALKQFLDGQSIAYTDIDVSANEAQRDEMQKLSGGLSVPVVVFDKGTGTQEVQVGFDQSKVKQALGLS